LTGDVSDQTRNDYVIFLANKSIVDNLNDGHDVILDATNVRSRERRSLLKYLKENVTVDFDALAKVFYVDPEICKIRIKLDMKNNVDRSNVPDYAIDRQYARFIGGLDKIESEGYKLI